MSMKRCSTGASTSLASSYCSGATVLPVATSASTRMPSRPVSVMALLACSGNSQYLDGCTLPPPTTMPRSVSRQAKSLASSPTGQTTVMVPGCCASSSCAAAAARQWIRRAGGERAAEARMHMHAYACMHPGGVLHLEGVRHGAREELLLRLQAQS